MTFEEAKEKLRERFPDGNIDHHPVGGDVFITLPLKDGTSERFCLTWQQAKYLAVTDLTGDDVKAQRFPEDWPK